MIYFSQNLVLLRKNKGLKQAELAEKLKISTATLSDYERGRTEPNLSVLLAISEFFRVDINNLLVNGGLKDGLKGLEKSNNGEGNPLSGVESYEAVIADLRKTISALEKVIKYNESEIEGLKKRLK